jgi:putative ABC transport system substrate-binding protein
LRKFGFIEGQNLVVDQRGFGARTDQFSSLAGELVGGAVDAIVCAGPIAARAALEVTRTVPIVANVNDFLGAGLVNSLARPSGNMTGVSFLATELNGKRQEILMELMTNGRRLGALADSNLYEARKVQELSDAAATRGFELSVYLVDSSDSILVAIDEAERQRVAALNVLASPFLNAQRFEIFERCTSRRMPAIYQWPENAEEGGLLGYGPRLTQIYRQIGRQLAKVFRGEKPSAVPIEQPTKFDLVINLKAAKALDLEVPPTLLARADEVIE